ncbi:MAG: putative glutamine transporter permease protein GlnM [Pseudomonadota bacterium]
MSPPPIQRRYSWRSKALRGLIYQIVALTLLIAAGAYLVHNTLDNMRSRGIQSGFDFILQPAGFSIGESLMEFDSAESYLKAFAVGLSNTFRVALAGIVLATLLGTLVGVGKLSRNFLVRTLSSAYVDLLRNVPLLLQLFIWYFVLTELLPPIDAPLRPLSTVYLSKNGLQFPIPVWHAGHVWTLLGLGLGAVAAWGWWRWATTQRVELARSVPRVLPALALLVVLPLLAWLLAGMPGEIDRPEKTEINLVGGGAVTPEYLTMLVGLTLYTAAYIAEVVRAGVQSVAYGQHEAATALGLTRGLELRLVLLPQALRVIIPPMTNQYLNLTKNSSLAVAVGYPDLVSISNTSLNQTGRAIECIALVMACYLTLSLLTSAAMNAYNKRAQLRER